MRCPKCKSVEDRVIDSRPVNHFAGIRRRRVCLNCEHRYTTFEQIERADLLVTKRDGRHEPFDRHKLYTGIAKACEKRPIPIAVLDGLTDQIIEDLEFTHMDELLSKDIGAKVMEKLYSIDAVAYVRYASVYRQFQDIGEFIDEIRSIENRPKSIGTQPELFNLPTSLTGEQESSAE